MGWHWCRRRMDLITRLGRSRDGSILPTFALLLIPLTLAVGGATDYVALQQTRSKLNAAADAAVLGAIGRSSVSLSTDDAQKLSATVFTDELPVSLASYVKTTTPTVTDNGTVRTASFAYTATIPTTFLKLIGLSKIEMDGSASGSTSLPAYIDFYLLLDNTPSMGVAATTAGIATMEANTDPKDPCAFACHVTSSSSDNYSLAKKLGVSMRIDVVRTATQKLMDTATTTQAVANQFRMAIYTFGASAETRKLTTISALTNNLSAAKNAANAIDLMSVPAQNYDHDRDTDFDGILKTMNSTIPNPGSGASASATPQKILFFVSDGVADAAYSSTCTEKVIDGPRCQEPLTVAQCTTIKNRGIKIAVLYTTYLPLPKNDWYMTYIAPFSSKIATNMQACASPGLYFEVSPSQGISEAMNALFTKAVQSAYLTR